MSPSDRHAGLWRVGAAAVAAVLVAEAAAWLLRPRDEAIDPAPVSERDYFSEAQIEGAVLVVLAVGRPRFVRRRLDGLARRPLLGAAAAGAALSLTLTAATLPTAAIAHDRSVDFGISTQGFGGWLGDQAKTAAIGAVFAAGGAALLIGMLRRFGRLWWIPGTVAVVALGALFSWLAPVVLAPIFNRFEPLPPGEARSDVLELGRRAGVDIGEVYEVDASRRSRALNAYVSGLGSTKRVVLYDTLLDKAREPELRS